MKDAFHASLDEVLQEQRTTPQGLAAEDAQQRLTQYGPNELSGERRGSKLALFLSQFSNPLMGLLIFTGILSAILGEIPEAIAISSIILINAVLGFIQEYRAEAAMTALKRISTPYATVLRNGQRTRIPAKEVVPGDVLLLEAGDIVAADARIMHAANLYIDEAVLTGESIPSLKVTNQFPEGTNIADQENMAFMGTAVSNGMGTAIVVATGMKTEFGTIAQSIRDTKRTQTPLQRKFTQLVKQIAIIVVILVLALLAFGLFTDKPFLGHDGLLFFALAISISTIPNSLPVIITVGLSIGSSTLAKKNMLIKKLAAAESLGSTTIICTDKTGTLTKNQMTITALYADAKTTTVTGTGYIPSGSFLKNGTQSGLSKTELLLACIGTTCNTASLTIKDGAHSIVGDPTEGALVVLARKAGFNETRERERILHEYPFDSDRKMMTVIVQDERTKIAYTKGAPDLLLKACTRILERGKERQITPRDRKRILEQNEAYAQQALRVLGFAYRRAPAKLPEKPEMVERDLVFVGLAGMIDPPREEVRHAIEQCHAAGIRVMMITGDHRITAKAIAQSIGLWDDDADILTGDELEQLTDEDLKARIARIRIVARALPIQKVRIVKALRSQGHIVAMTGDGVNDAPALKHADIGIAMGSGTDVAREVAKATLVDDNFSSIVNAVAEGRNIYDKIIRSARYLLSCNAGEITAVLITTAAALPLPLLPLQVLLMNILTDDLPALGLGTEPSDNSVMNRQPQNPHEHPIRGKILISILVFGIIMGLSAYFIYRQWLDPMDVAGTLPTAQTMAFTTLVMTQMFAVLSSRSLGPNLKRLNPFTNPWLLTAVIVSIGIQFLVVYWTPLQGIFGTVALNASQWGEIIAVSFAGFAMMEVSKLVLSLKGRHAVPA